MRAVIFDMDGVLRIPSESVFAELLTKPGIPPEWLIEQPIIESRVRVDAVAERWDVAVEIPFVLVCEASCPKSGDQWLFSFSRYDYTRGRDKPVLSSTSPHAVLNFHRQEEWDELRFM